MKLSEKLLCFPYANWFTGFFTLRVMSQGWVEEKFTTAFSLIWATPHERAPSREKNCSTLVCAGLSPGFPAWLNDFQVCKTNDFLNPVVFLQQPHSKPQIKSSGNALSHEMDAKMTVRTQYLLALRTGFVLECRHRNTSQIPGLSNKSQDINCCPKTNPGELQ